MNRIHLIVRVTVTIALMIGTACAKHESGTEAFHPLEIGTAVPMYVGTTLGGDTIRVGGAESLTVLNVWATWCVSCADEMSALDSLHREFGSHGLRVIGVSVDDGNEARVRQFAQSTHLGFTIVHDPSGAIERTYEVVGLPTTFVISRDGQLLWRHTGDITNVLSDARQVIIRASLRPQ